MSLATARKRIGAMSKKHMGSSIDDFLKEEGILEETQVQVIKEVVAWQLRASYQGVLPRPDFFAGKAVVVLSHGITKEDQVPYREIDRAIKRKEQVQRDFGRYTFRPE